MKNIKTLLMRAKEKSKGLLSSKISKQNVKAIAVASVIAGTIIFSSPYFKNSRDLNAVAKAQAVSGINLEERTENPETIQADDKEDFELDKVTEEKNTQYNDISEIEELDDLEEKKEALIEVAEKEAAEQADALAQYSSKDISIMQRIVEAEATSEDIKGKILVANVVINRVESSNFPNSIEGVVFQKRQFSPISDGRYYSVTVTESTKEAVNRALQGEDYSNDALYFAARSMANSKNMRWFDSKLTYLFQHGCHEFFK